MKFELDDGIYEKIKFFSKNGDIFQNNKDYENAVKMYNRALALVPEPKTSWEATTWLLTALGETYFYLKWYQEAEQSFVEAFKCPGGKSNPFIHFRLGQTYYEFDKLEAAKTELTIAYRLDPAVFIDENEKYLRSIE